MERAIFCMAALAMCAGCGLAPPPKLYVCSDNLGHAVRFNEGQSKAQGGFFYVRTTDGLEHVYSGSFTLTCRAST